MTNQKPVLLMTRPAEETERSLKMLQRTLLARVRVVKSPLLRIQFREIDCEFSGMRGSIFTSRQGVRAITHVTECRGLPAYCVGRVTTEEACRDGWRAECLGTNSRELVTALVLQKPDAPLIHFCGRHVRGDVAQTLSAAGYETQECVVYEQFAEQLTSDARRVLTSERTVIVPLFSARTARLFVQNAMDQSTLILAAFSEDVAAELRNMIDSPVYISEEPTAAAMSVLINSLLASVPESVESGSS